MAYSASDEDNDSISLSFQLVVDSVPTLAYAIIGNHTYVKDQAIGDLQLPQAGGGTGTVSYSLTATTTDGTVGQRRQSCRRVWISPPAPAPCLEPRRLSAPIP